MKKLIVIFSLFFCFTFNTEAFSQIFDCEYVSKSITASTSPSFQGLSKPNRTTHSGDTVISDAYFPVVIVFVQFQDSPGFFDWPSPSTNNGKPIFLDSLIGSFAAFNDQNDWWDAYNQYTQRFSDRWLEVSRGKFHVLGVAHSVVLSGNRSSYTNERIMNQEIFDSLSAQNIIWADYDRWGFDANHNSFTYHPDGEVDMIYRMVKGRANGMEQTRAGYNILGFYSGPHEMIQGGDTTDIHPQSSGVTMAGWEGYGFMFGGLFHEHSHDTYMPGHMTYSVVSFGFGFESFFSPNDFVVNEYMQDTVFDYTSGVDFLLDDYASHHQNLTGNLLRVPIGGNEFFTLANRGQTYWDSNMGGDTAMVTRPPDEYKKGLYIYHFSEFYRPAGNFADESILDMECADGYFNWEFAGWHYRTVPQTCFQSPGTPWPHWKVSSVRYDNDSATINKWNNVGDGISFHRNRRTYIGPTINDSGWAGTPKWWGIGKAENNACVVGTHRNYVNDEEIYSMEEFAGDRNDAWRPGYNEVFSPYSSPSSCAWSNEYTGIFIWYHQIDHERADLKIFRDVNEGGNHSLSEILEATPPSRPMGLKLEEVFDTSSGSCHPKLIWNHNMEPDMLRGTGQKRYEVYKATQSDMSSVPVSFSLIGTIDIDTSVTPSYIDSTVNEYDCSVLDGPPFGDPYPIRYKIKAVDNGSSNDLRYSVFSDFVSVVGLSEGGKEDDRMPSLSSEITKYEIHQNYPNPFNPTTKIKYSLPKAGFVSIKIYDVVGRMIKELVNEVQEIGNYSITFDGSQFSSGVYFYRIETNNFIDTKRMVLIK